MKTLPPYPPQPGRIEIADADRTKSGNIAVVLVFTDNICRAFLWSSDEWERACALADDPSSGVSDVRAATLERWP